MVRVSVIVPTKNRPTLLRAALTSIVDQGLGADVEVLVVNDAGSNVNDVVAEFTQWLRITAINLTTCQGAAHARNVAIDLARGTYIAFLDDDDIFLSNHLSTGLAVLENSGCDLVYAGAYVSNVRFDDPRDYEARGSALRQKCFMFDDRMLLVANYIHTGAILVRNFRASPVRFDETLSVCEDWDFWLTLRLVADFDFVRIEQITSVYHQLPTEEGLINQGESAALNPFTCIREKIYERWPAGDELVLSGRRWFAEFDRRSSQVVADGLLLPRHFYDQALDILRDCFDRVSEPTKAQLDDLFASCLSSSAPEPMW